MTTLTRNLTQIDGANVAAPTQNGFSATSLEVFANDAAYEAVYGAGQQGDKYFNSTELLEREHDGTGWVYVNKALTATTDSSTTGADNDLAATRFDLLRFTEGSLTSIRSIDPAQHKILYMVNDQAGTQTITWNNEDGAATAANRIVTGTGDNVIQEVGQTLVMVYDSEASRWRIAGGTGSGGGGLEIEVVTNAESPVTGEIGKWYVTDTSSGEININLPDISAIPSSQQANAAIRVSDCKNNWHINKVTLTPFSGDSIDGNATDEVMDLDVEGQYVWVAREAATSWCFDTNIQPTETGTTGTGTGFKNYVLSPDTSDDVVSTGGAVAATHVTVADLPENQTKTTGILCTISSGSIGNTSTWDTTPIDNGDDGKNGSPDGYWKTKSGYADGAASFRWINTDTSKVMFTYPIPANSEGRISDVVVNQVILTKAQNIKPQIYWNVTSETNGVVLSGMGTLAETRLTGSVVTDWKDVTSDLTLSPGFDAQAETKIFRSQVGNTYKYRGVVDIGSSTASNAYIDLDHNVNTDDLPNTTSDTTIHVLSGVARRMNTTNNYSSAAYVYAWGVDSDTPNRIYIREAPASSTDFGGPRAVSGILSSGDSLFFEVDVPTDFDGSVMFGTEAQAQNATASMSMDALTALGSGTNDYNPDNLSYDSNSFTYNSGTKELTPLFSGRVAVSGSMRITTANANFGLSVTDGSNSKTFASYQGASNANKVQGSCRFDVTEGTPFKFTTYSISATTFAGGAPSNYIDIDRYADKSSKATGFPLSSITSSTPEYLVGESYKGTFAAYVTNGSSGGSSVNIEYEVAYGMCHLRIPTVSFTTTSVTLYLSNSPSSIAWPSDLLPETDQVVLVRVRDIGNYHIAVLKIDAAGTDNLIGIDANFANFTAASGAKGIEQTSVSYKLRT